MSFFVRQTGTFDSKGRSVPVVSWANDSLLATWKLESFQTDLAEAHVGDSFPEMAAYAIAIHWMDVEFHNTSMLDLWAFYKPDGNNFSERFYCRVFQKNNGRGWEITERAWHGCDLTAKLAVAEIEERERLGLDVYLKSDLDELPSLQRFIIPR